MVNEREELKILYEKAVLAVKSLLKLLETEIGAQEQTKGLFGFGVSWHFKHNKIQHEMHLKNIHIIETFFSLRYCRKCLI